MMATKEVQLQEESPASFLANVWRLMRPQQWIKNGFVLVGLLFANAWHDRPTVQRVLIAAVAFCLVASAIYVFNDLLDRRADLNHSKKRLRPLAAGLISPLVAVILASLLLILGLSLGLLVSREVLAILMLYVLINVAYSLGLKHVVLLDVFLIAAGFMLRILAGTVGVGIPPSQWLLLCGLMIALFLGFSKRRAELYASSGNGGGRKVLDHYQPVLLDKMIVITATCVILTYSLYTMSPVTIAVHKTDRLIYTVPFVMYGIFRYIFSLHSRATGAEPSQEIFRDPHILLSIVGWLLVTLWLIS
jgi:4-hydroxybenzoate polyprenyltransferase